MSFNNTFCTIIYRVCSSIMYKMWAVQWRKTQVLSCMCRQDEKTSVIGCKYCLVFVDRVKRHLSLLVLRSKAHSMKQQQKKSNIFHFENLSKSDPNKLSGRICFFFFFNLKTDTLWSIQFMNRFLTSKLHEI